MVLSWPSIELGGASAHIPRVCPNCMGHADREWRCGYKLLLLGSTRYYQTFYYCADCTEVIRHQRRTTMIQWILGIVLVIAMMILWGMLSDQHVFAKENGGIALVGLAVVVPIAVALLFGVLRRSGKPLKPNMLGRDFAAYYTGQSGLGLGNKSIYRARRKEWLDLLRDANRPATATSEKPF